MSSPDDNALLQAGTLPRDPFSGTTPVVRKPPGRPADDEVTTLPDWPPPVGEAALEGLAGDFVRAFSPHSEADPMALLSQFLVGFGSVIGRSAHYLVESDRHYTNEYLVLVGDTSKGRKGSSLSRVKSLLSQADPAWGSSCVASGMSSGEGLIHAVRDPREEQQPIRDKGRVVDYQMVTVDKGVSDKRAFFTESELASVLKLMAREGNTLSAVTRDAWDNGNLRITNKNSPEKATGAHISFIGHVTTDELLRYLNTTEMGNGYANRILWCRVRRSKILPDPGSPPEDVVRALGDRITEAIGFARTVDRMTRTSDAEALWRKLYADLSASLPGLIGALTARSEAHVLRLSCIYALLDLSASVHPCHLRSALAFWLYCQDSVKSIFGEALGNPLADSILVILRDATGPIKRSDLRAILGDHHLKADELTRALRTLHSAGLAVRDTVKTGGRSAETWTAVRATVGIDGTNGINAAAPSPPPLGDKPELTPPQPRHAP